MYQPTLWEQDGHVSTSTVAGHTTPDEVNRAVWQESAEVFEGLLGWLDRGEEISMLAVASAVRGEPVLDLGVGGGRTTSLLRMLTDDYVGLDYTPAMVEACRRRFPAEHFVHGDARDLSAFPDGHFALVFFSFNGIDAVDHDDRLRILSEARRVLRPGGYFVFNSHNHDGPSFSDRPWNMRPLTPLPARRVVYNVLRRTAELPFSVANFRRLRAASCDTGTYGLHPSASHRFGIVIYFSTAIAQRDALLDAGFDAVDLYTDVDGARIDAAADTSRCVWLYYVARAPLAS